ncbi:hypothetical protein E2C01_101585 [Portunus trituberculatus]|uniref:Uncharacterized protein n=1 Tax=Portunus trituberculatus TaxID=210409 RepID=A0A5B7KGE6_PORTR|nr:hypothetical protein [Portunus trituberculatus]
MLSEGGEVSDGEALLACLAVSSGKGEGGGREVAADEVENLVMAAARTWCWAAAALETEAGSQPITAKLPRLVPHLANSNPEISLKRCSGPRSWLCGEMPPFHDRGPIFDESQN